VIYHVSHAFAELRGALLPKRLSGELRVPNDCIDHA
jgi:hypothetical protein